MEADQARRKIVGLNGLCQSKLLDLWAVVIQYTHALAVVLQPRERSVPDLQRRHVESRPTDLLRRQAPALTDAPEPPPGPLWVERDEIDNPVPFPHWKNNVDRSIIAWLE